MAKTSLRQFIGEAVKRAFVAGAEWALIQSGIDSANASRQINEWRKMQTPPALPIIQDATREKFCRAVMEAIIDQTALEQERLWWGGGERDEARAAAAGASSRGVHHRNRVESAGVAEQVEIPLPSP